MFSIKGGGYKLEVFTMFNFKFSAIIYGRGLMLLFNIILNP